MPPMNPASSTPLPARPLALPNLLTYARIAAFSGTQPEATVAYFQKAQSSSDWKTEIATAEQQAQIMAFIEQGLD